MTFQTPRIFCAVLALLIAGCGDHQPQQRLVAFSQANNADVYISFP